MKDVWEYLKGLFQKESDSSASNPYLHEVIERTEEEKAAYESWKGSLAQRRMIDWLFDQYAIWQALPDDIDPSIDFLNTPSSKGFVIHLFKRNESRASAVFLTEYLKEQVLALNYKLQLADLRSWSQDARVDTVERFYLKPRPGHSENNKTNQRFGNITIELTLRNDRPHHLKFQATSYSDHLYTEAEEFRNLMQAVLVSSD